MPQKLTQEWRRALGDSAEDVHGAYRDRLANLTLSGDATNAGLGTRPFVEKADIYRDSPIGMTRRVASEAEWNEEALERRAEQLASEALNLWPWESASQTASEQTPFKWRIDGGEWRMADTGSGLVLDVAAALLAQDPQNVERFSGGTLSRDLQPASRFPPNSKAGTLTLRAVPGRDDVVIYPYGSYPESAERCRQMGARCGVDVEVLLANENRTAALWRFFKERTGGVPGQKDSWRGPSQWTSTLNADGDRVGIHVGNEELVWLYIRSGLGAERASERAARMRHYSWLIQQTLGDQQLGDNLDKNAEDGTSITVQRPWVRDDEDEWAEVAVWIKDQQERLAAVLGSD